MSQQSQALVPRGQNLRRRGPPPGYNGLLKLGIIRYHKTADSLAARRHLAQLFTNAAHRLKNVRNVERCLEQFDQYVRTLSDDHTAVADARVRIDLSGVGFLELTGEIHRVDIIDAGTRAILLGDYPDDWHMQLRFPLIQRAIARHYAVPEGRSPLASSAWMGLACKRRRLPR